MHGEGVGCWEWYNGGMLRYGTGELYVTCAPITFSVKGGLLHPENRTFLQKFLNPGFYLKPWKNISLSSFDDSWNLQAYISVGKKKLRNKLKHLFYLR